MKTLEAVADALAGVARGATALHAPDLVEDDARAVAECVRSSWVSTAGEQVPQLEAELVRVTGAGACVATTSGTAGLLVALLTLEVGPGDLVLVPDLTFVSPAAAVVHAGATPCVVDVEPDQLGVDPAALDEQLNERVFGQRPRALIVVHVGGTPARVAELRAVCDRHQVTLIEDAAQALGARVGEEHVGQFGDVGVLSFNGNKLITAGGGGALLFSDEERAARARQLSSSGIVAGLAEVAGRNCRMPALNASLARSQLSRLGARLHAHREGLARYAVAVEPFDGVDLVSARPGDVANGWQPIVRVSGGRGPRDELLQALSSRGVAASIIWPLLSRQPFLAEGPRAPTPNAAVLVDELLFLPAAPT